MTQRMRRSASKRKVTTRKYKKKAPHHAELKHPLAIQRADAGLSRKRVAEELDVDYVTLWRWETTGIVPFRAMEKAWARALRACA